MARNKKSIKQVCEICYRKPANSLTHSREDNKWYFSCQSCLTDGYEITFDRIHEMDWLAHMVLKGWIHQESFFPRFEWAFKQTSTQSGKEEYEQTHRIS